MSDLADFELPRDHRALLRTLVPVIAPPGEAERLGVIEACVDEAELIMRALPKVVRLALAAGMTTYDQTARLHPRNLGRAAHALDGKGAHRWFDFWRHGNALQRNFIKGIKGIIGMAYYELRPVQDAMGYTPHQWIDKVKATRLQVYADDIAAHEATVFERDPLPLPSEVAARAGSDAHIPTSKEAS